MGAEKERLRKLRESETRSLTLKREYIDLKKLNIEVTICWIQYSRQSIKGLH
jgi:RNA-binding protein YlmH